MIYNYVHNPRAHLGVSGWTCAGGTLGRSTTQVLGQWPSGGVTDTLHTVSDAYFILPAGVGPALSTPAALHGEDELEWTLQFASDGSASDGCHLTANAVFYSGGSVLQTVALVSQPYHVEAGVWGLTGWRVTVPAGADAVALSVLVVAAEGGDGYFTLACLGSPDYRDGDVAGWEWTGTPHNSVSRGPGGSSGPGDPAEADFEPSASLLINGGAVVVFDPSVSLSIGSGNMQALQMRLRNADGEWEDWQPYASSRPWSLTPGLGARRVEVQFWSDEVAD